MAGSCHWRELQELGGRRSLHFRASSGGRAGGHHHQFWQIPGRAWGGQLGSMGHASFPWSATRGRIYLNPSEWRSTKSFALVGDPITQWLSHDIGHVLRLQHTHKQDQCSIWMRRNASVHLDAVRHGPFWCLMTGVRAARNPPSAHGGVGMAQNELVTAPASSAAQTSAPGHRCLPPHKPLRQDRSRCRDQAGTGQDRCQRHRRCR